MSIQVARDNLIQMRAEKKIITCENRDAEMQCALEICPDKKKRKINKGNKNIYIII